MSDVVGIGELMETSGVKFGTSGARGLVTAMTDRVCAAYTLAFLEYLRNDRGLAPDTPVAIAGDRRPSTPRILAAVALAAEHLGHPVEFSGYVPSPAVALRGLEAGYPTVMVTGSHIPDDRNGIKFNTPHGEITKDDEAGMRSRSVTLPDAFDSSGMAKSPVALGEPNSAAAAAYLKRWLDAFPKNCLAGVRLGVYGHSAVGRDLLVDLYTRLGAEVVRLGFSEVFVPVDTEAIRTEDVRLAREWAASEKLDAIVSTDGDSDRPLIADETGEWLRGDVAGIHTARFFSADAVSTPVSCNTAVELCGSFAEVIRTRIGSPFVIAGMDEAVRAGRRAVVGYEANGGFLTATPLTVPGGSTLAPLPTRDPVIVQLSILLTARRKGQPVSTLENDLPRRFTASDRDTSFARERSEALLGRLREMAPADLAGAFDLGPAGPVNQTDGFRVPFESGEIVHLRPSGNAPELRCYAEASTPERATELVAHGLEVARRLA